MSYPPNQWVRTYFVCGHCNGYFETTKEFMDHVKTCPEGFDPVNRPKHYNVHPSGVECIEVTEHMSFCIGNAIKYLWRCDMKNGIEDLEKAKWYINREIERRKAVPT